MYINYKTYFCLDNFGIKHFKTQKQIALRISVHDGFTQ